MLQAFASILRDHCGIDSPSLMVVGVSGGPDSLCLMHLLHALGHRLIVAHLDHRLRPESGDEAAAVARATAALGLEFVLERADVRAHARLGRLSIEEAARDLRYRFLFEQARRHRAHAVAVGHTADDQVETVIMHLIRGAGMSGLRGMTYRTLLPGFDASLPLLRPLLGVWRRETVEYCRAHSLAPQHDRSNESKEYLRNRLRHELIPLLETYNPRVREAIWRTAQAVASDLAMVEEHVGEAWRATVLREGRGFVGFDAVALSGRSEPVRRRLMLMAARRLMPDVEIGFSDLGRAGSLLSDLRIKHVDLGGGLLVSREAGVVYVSRGEERLPTQDWPQMAQEPIPIVTQESVAVALENGWQFSVEHAPSAHPLAELQSRAQDAYRVFLDADELPPRLELRPPRPGDRFQPLGLEGHSQKLSDFFVNSRTPRRARARWPLLCTDQVLVWIPGYRPAEAFKLREKTTRAVCFAVSRIVPEGTA